MAKEDFELEVLCEVWNNRDGNHIEVGPDRDGLGLVEIREKDVEGKIIARISMEPHAAALLIEAIDKVLECNK